MQIRKQFQCIKRQAGMTLTETLLALGIASVVAVIGYQGYKMATSDVASGDQTSATVAMIGKIKQVFGMSGSYSLLSTTPGKQLNDAGLLPEQFLFDPNDNKIYDVFRNEINMSGAVRSFAVMFNGLTRDNCSKVASGLGTVAYKITVGTDAAHASGAVSGTNVYKDVASGVLDGAKLAAGCGETGAKLAVEIR